MEYETLSIHHKLLIAKDALRAAETDHYRVSLDPASGGGEARLVELEARVRRTRREVRKVEAEVALATGEPAPPVDPDEPVEAEPVP